MNINIIKILLTLIIVFIFNSPGFCTELPGNVKSFILEKFPEAKIRFDGMVELPDGTNYLPILPIVYPDKEKPIEITQTIPKDENFIQKPDMILFNDNLALLKIIKEKGKQPTVISSNKMPLKVKLGLLPQDLVVPRGLVLPSELKVILGDLKIPLKPAIDKEGEIAFYGKTEINEKNDDQITALPELDFLKGQKIYALSHKSNLLNVIDSRTGRVEKTIKLPSIAFNMVISSDKRYLLMAAPVKNKIFIVDTFNNEFVKSIEVGKLPYSIISPPGMKKAFVANRLSSNISEIDLTNMRVDNTIQVAGYPDNLQITDNKNFLYYSDRRSGEIYRLNLKNDASQELLQVKNISKIGQFDKYLLVLSRSSNTLTVFDLKKNKVIKETQTGKKPLDLKVLHDTPQILVVCAGSDELDIIDVADFDVIKKIPLKSEGFPGGITLLDKGNKAFIINNDAYEIIIYNVAAEKIEGELPVSSIVNSVVIINQGK